MNTFIDPSPQPDHQQRPPAPIPVLSREDLEALGYRTLTRAEYDDLVLMEELA